MQNRPIGRWFLWSCFMVGLAGCGNASLVSGDDPATVSDAAQRVSSRLSCDPSRQLVVEIAADGATLSRDIEPAGLQSGTIVSGMSVEGFGLSESDRLTVLERISQLANQTLSPFGVGVRVLGAPTAMNDASIPIADTAEDSPNLADAPAARVVPTSVLPHEEVIARIIVTQVTGAPEHCGCQGHTSALGLQPDGPAEGVVFANAFLENGLSTALNRYPTEQRIEMLAVALTNSILHETGHTLGLVHLDVAGQPTLLMARGGSSAARVSLRAMTTLQTFSPDALPTTSDAAGVRDAQCDTCVMEDSLAARRSCAL